MRKRTHHQSFRMLFLNAPVQHLRKAAWGIIFFFAFAITASAQTATIGSINDFKNSLQAKQGSNLRGEAGGTIQTPDDTYAVKVNRSTFANETETLVGEVPGNAGSHFIFTIVNGKLEGLLFLPLIQKAYRFYTDEHGLVQVEIFDINKLICASYEKFSEPSSSPNQRVEAVPPSTSPVYKLQSFPGATAVAYLDFDGEVSTTSYWNGGNTINAQPGNFSETDITNIFNLVSEDFRAFKINITTDLAVFQAAPVNRRMRCIFTPNDIAAPGSGGVAYLKSFSWNNDTPCWVFNSGSKAAGEAAAHELGHTFGLSHDGRTSPSEGYYGGHGIWAPIMGVGYSRGLSQWSKGEYVSANNQEDDLAIISNSTNGFGYRTDEDGGTVATAKALVIGTNGAVTASQNTGVITTRTDVDYYSFTTGGGSVTLTVSPSPAYPDLDLQVQIVDAAGTVLATANPTAATSGSQTGTNPLTGLAATATASLVAGTYYVTVDGVGQGNLTTGYSDYGSIGAYSLSGTVPVATGNLAPVVTITSPATGASYTAPATVNITATATDDGTVTKVDFYNGSVFLGTDATSPYSFSWTSVAVGSYSLRAVATDNAGLNSTATVAVQVTATNQPPVVSLTSPTEGATFTAPATVVINATATDDGSITRVDFYNGSILLGSDATAPYSYTWNNVAARNYTVRAVAVDNTGLTTSASANILVNPAPAVISTVYKDCNYGGYAVNLSVGNYTLTQLRALGILNDDISSLRVTAGYEIVLYQHDNFGGTALIFRSEDACLVDNSFNDAASSARVRLSTAAAAQGVPALTAFPNPATDAVTITFVNVAERSLTVLVLDSYGQELAKQEVRDGEQINLGGLPTGIYSLRALSGQHLLVTKIVKR